MNNVFCTKKVLHIKCFYKKTVLIFFVIATLSHPSFGMFSYCCQKKEDQIKEIIRPVAARLHHAIYRNRIEEVHTILEEELKNLTGQSFLQFINTPYENFLPHFTYLMTAITLDRIEIVKTILATARERLDVELFKQFIITYINGLAPALGQAAISGQLDIVQLIICATKHLAPIEFDAFIMETDLEGKTALEKAREKKYYETETALEAALIWNNLRLALAHSKKKQELKRKIQAYTKTENREWPAKINQLSAKFTKQVQTFEDALEVEALE